MDLQDAYLLVWIYAGHRKYLRFRFKGKLYQYLCLPFGLCSSPYVFTKVTKPVVYTLRSWGILLVLYLDDFLFIHKSKAACEKNIKKAIRLLEELGFIINFKKSSLVAAQTCKYLGFIIDSVNFFLNLTCKKKDSIVRLVSEFKVGREYKIRKFAEFLGILTSACPAVAYGFIHCKQLERQKYLALKFNGNNYEGKIVINENMLEDLDWWKINAAIGSNPIKTQKYVMEIFSDSSLTGWGCYCNGEKAFGFWDEKERKKHINYLELLAAFFAIKCFAANLSNCEVLLRLDNTTAISYVNRAGGVRFRHLSMLSKKIWRWCEERRLWLKASYIPSAENTEADRASRNVNADTEWELSGSAFSKIEKQFGPFSVDLFASRLNKKCRRFYSRFPDPQASSVDAFTVSWKNEKFYAFPPFALIMRTLRKIVIDQATRTVVVPMWPTQPWYPLFTSLAIEPTMPRESSTSIPPFVGGRQVIRSAYINKGISEEAADVMVGAITSSTLKQYNCNLKRWWEYTYCNGINIYNAKTSEIIKFLAEIFKNGAQYGTLNMARSTIALISAYDINSDGLIARFLKGVFKQRPTKPRYNTTWDVAPVLDYLEKKHPLKKLKMKDAAEKVAILLALTTGQRLQTLALINIDNIEKSKSGVKIKIPDQIKTTKPGSFQPELVLPFFQNKPDLCVASAVLEYLDCTKKQRQKETKNLFLSTVKPFGKASSQTIGHWIKALLGKAGVDIEKFTAYSTRHAAVSKAHKRGVDISVIKSCAGWSPGSQTFFKFYNRPVLNPNDQFAKAILE
ncbi:uncharacterized protein [Cardiocondyla obscurior]|uniref:uncharacterized protein n=1 Tax=Cardiocondyla obscurior TaxID=286306 RepID=UPI0039658C52